LLPPGLYFTQASLFGKAGWVLGGRAGHCADKKKRAEKKGTQILYNNKGLALIEARGSS